MFQAVVFAGGTGSRIYPLAEVQAKALLPVVNRHLLSYPLRLLEKYGFSDVIVVTNTSTQDAVGNFLREECGGLKWDMVAVNAEMETADVLRSISDRIKSDFILVSGDLVTDVMLHHVTDTHSLNDSFVTVMLYPAPTAAPGVDQDAGLVDYIGLDSKESNLLYLAPAADVDDGLVLSKRLLRKHPNVTIRKDLRDSHLYVFSKQVLQILEAKKSITSIKEELIPYLIKKQFSNSPLPGVTDGLDESSSHALAPITPIKCAAYIYRTGICLRVNSLTSYRDANFLVARGVVTELTPWDQPVRQSDSEKVGSNCVVGSAVGDKSSVKASIVGRGCQIGKKVKIVNSIIMNHVVIGDGVTISNCVVCNHARIQEGISLTQCTVGDARIVDVDAKTDVLVRAES